MILSNSRMPVEKVRYYPYNSYNLHSNLYIKIVKRRGDKQLPWLTLIVYCISIDYWEEYYNIISVFVYIDFIDSSN